MHGHQHDLVAFLILLAGSVVMPILSGRLRVPSAILLIVYGFLMGPHVAGLLHDDTVVAFLSEIGFMVLMFLAGLEIDFNSIKAKGLRALATIFAICAVIFGLAFACSWAFGLHPIFGLALGATSVGLPLAVLNETGRLRTPLGRAVLLLGSVGEFLTVLGMTLFYFVFRYGLSAELFFGLGKLAAVLAITAVTLRFLMAAAWWRPRTFSRIVEQHDGAEMGVRAALLLMMAFSLVASLANVEAIVGAFIAGSLISFVFRGKQVLEEKLATVGYGLFVPIFFVVVGVRFDPEAVTVASLLLAAQLLGAALLVKLVPCMGLLLEGMSLRNSVSIGLLLSAPLTLVVAIAEVGVELEALSPASESALIVLAIASGVVFPVGFRALAGGGGDRQHLSLPPNDGQRNREHDEEHQHRSR